MKVLARFPSECHNAVAEKLFHEMRFQTQLTAVSMRHANLAGGNGASFGPEAFVDGALAIQWVSSSVWAWTKATMGKEV